MEGMTEELIRREKIRTRRRSKEYLKSKAKERNSVMFKGKNENIYDWSIRE